MNNIGRMYNASENRGSGSGNPPLSSSGRPMPLSMSGRTENFYRTAQENKPQTDVSPPGRASQPASGGILSQMGLPQLSLPSLGGLFGEGKSGSVGASIKGLLSRIGEDDILLILMILILINENKEDDYLALVILALILLT